MVAELPVVLEARAGECRPGTELAAQLAEPAAAGAGADRVRRVAVDLDPLVVDAAEQAQRLVRFAVDLQARAVAGGVEHARRGEVEKVPLLIEVACGERPQVPGAGERLVEMQRRHFLAELQVVVEIPVEGRPAAGEQLVDLRGQPLGHLEPRVQGAGVVVETVGRRVGTILEAAGAGRQRARQAGGDAVGRERVAGETQPGALAARH